MKKLMAYLDGNKTIICLAIPTILEKMVELGILDNTKWVAFAGWIFIALGTGAFLHHAKKGYLSADKGK